MGGGRGLYKEVVIAWRRVREGTVHKGGGGITLGILWYMNSVIRIENLTNSDANNRSLANSLCTAH